MLILRCTNRLLKYYGLKVDTEGCSSTTALGDWYANLVPLIHAGNLFIFVNEKSLLTVALPMTPDIGPETLLSMFNLRVLNLLHALNIPEEECYAEIAQMQQIKFGKTANKSVLGSMTDLSFHYDAHAEVNYRGKPLELSKIELALANMPHKMFKYALPCEMAALLLKGTSGEEILQ